MPCGTIRGIGQLFDGYNGTCQIWAKYMSRGGKEKGVWEVDVVSGGIGRSL